MTDLDVEPLELTSQGEPFVVLREGMDEGEEKQEKGEKTEEEGEGVIDHLTVSVCS